MLQSYGHFQLFGERRLDKMDVKALSNRMEIEISKNDVAAVPLGKSLLFNMASKYLNKSVFWKIYPTDLNYESKLACSTLIALLNPSEPG